MATLPPPPEGSADVRELTDLMPDVVTTVRGWLADSAAFPTGRAARRLGRLLEDPAGLPFASSFIDGVIRPEDNRVAAGRLAELAPGVPSFLPWHVRVGLRIGAWVGLVVPDLVVPVVRRVLRGMLAHLVVDARDRPLGAAIEKLRSGGSRLNLNVLGEAVLGEREASRRLDATHRLLARDDVDYVSIKVSATVAPHSAWAFEEAVARAVEVLTPLLRRAATCSPAKFVNLDMEEYRDLQLTVAVFTRLLDQPEFLGLEAGIVLQAYLPDALQTMQELQAWSAARRAHGGAPIKVRVVKGANLPMERVDAALHGWPLATWPTKQDTDTNYLRLLDYALRPERIDNVRIGVAGHNLFHVAFAWLLAGRRGVRGGMDVEMLLGMAPGQAEAVRRDVDGLLLYTPVVHPREFDVAIAYLMRRLEEGASIDNYMSAVFGLHRDQALFERERERFAAALFALDRAVPAPNRRQDRRRGGAGPTERGFQNVPDTDPALRANLEWGRAILTRVPSSALGVDLAEEWTVTTPAALDQRVARAVTVAVEWGARSGAERAAVLRRAAGALESRRAELLEVMAAECGKTLDEGDPEVSEAVDFANYYATLAEQLDRVDGATARPVPLTVVAPPWNFPVSIPAGSTLAALAAGSAVILKPAPQARRCGAVLVQALLSAGFPPGVLQLVDVEEGSLGRQLVAHPHVGRVVLTGGYETAELFRSFRHDLPLLAETSGKNAVIVTASADLDLAVKDVVHSAFGHAGQKCSAASLVILAGPAARSRRFRDQLVDAVTSLRVGMPSDPASQMGPIIEPPQGKLLRALTTLDPGERWLVAPRPLDGDQTGRLWSPGVKEGITPGSWFHLTECFGPVLGIMTARSLAHAIELQNAVPYGLTAGLFTLDPADVRLWLDRVEAGNVYINRSITGAIVRRQPFGGWKRSAVGAGTKAGGPNYLIGLVDWESAPAYARAEIGVPAALLRAARSVGMDGADMLERSLRSDAAAWASEFGIARDISQLGFERNVLRYLPVPVTVRFAGGPLADLLRVVAAGLLAGSAVTVSAAVDVPEAVRGAITALGVPVTAEGEVDWVRRLRGMDGGRVRLVGGRAADVYAAVAGRPDLAVYAQPVTEAGRVELLPFLHEQAISATAHRLGTPGTLLDVALPLRPSARDSVAVPAP